MSKKIIVDTNDITDEMKDSLEICEKSFYNTKTVFRLSGHKPECFAEYDAITDLEFTKIRTVDEPDVWCPIPDWAPQLTRELIDD